ncbi:non-specific serine/threonine protein kinase [Ranunculus cassubicifolius]
MGNDTDRHALLAIKEGITQDPHGVMSSWNESTHFCNWLGVTCSLRHRQRVMGLNLGNHELFGTISPSVGNLSFLREFNLSNNNFNGNIPEEFGRLSRLQLLDLSHNSMGGEIPVNLSACAELSNLILQYNGLEGSIPFQLSSLKKLSFLYLGANHLTGTIPPSIGNCSLLRNLSMARNTLHGSIPNEFGQLSQLQHFAVSFNMLYGIIPPSLYNITSLYVFSVAGNKMNGSISSSVGQTLPNLKYFYLDGNSFQGPIPVSLSNASKLEILNIGFNNFTGSVPKNLGSLQSLTILGLGDNKLGYERDDDLNFINSLSNCTFLEYLSLNDNRLGGVLPESIGNLSTHLQSLVLGRTLIGGPIPRSIENLVGLVTLGLETNQFIGSIPSGIGKLHKLNVLILNSNRLSGQIPFSLGNLTRLIYLHMRANRLQGTIPPSLGNSQALLELDVSSNKLSGTIPKQLFTLSSLIFCFLSNNFLSGNLPSEVGTLINLERLAASNNSLSSKIPSTLGSCLKLEFLSLGSNKFQGPIPNSLKDLKGIKGIDLSHNNLTGKIPEFLMNLPILDYLNLSYNDFEGEVAKKGIFRNASAISVLSNKKLCGGIKELHLPICVEIEVHRSRHVLSRRITIIISVGVLSFILVVISCSAYGLRMFRKANSTSAAPTTSSALEKWKSGASYLEIFNSTNGFSSELLIGTGSFGSVYKGVLSDEETYVAIKVLNLQLKGASKSFTAECEALKNIRHRNLIKVVTVCSSIDFEGNDFKALIFEFIPNGSLEQWLHPTHTDDQQQSRALSFVQRLNIAIDIAFGLEYLHHGYGETIVHCDIKPSNVLLDMDMVVRVGDFGLAKFIFNTVDDQSETQTLSSGLKGSIGYIPLEYGVGGKVSTSGDMYSYGILLLEMFTGKNPTSEMFKDGLSLYEFVASALPDHVLEIVDASLFSETLEDGEDDGERGNVDESEEAPVLSRRTMEWKRGECLVSILEIALSCSAPLPKDRAVVSDIIKKLISVRELFTCTP